MAAEQILRPRSADGNRQARSAQLLFIFRVVASIPPYKYTDRQGGIMKANTAALFAVTAALIFLRTATAAESFISCPVNQLEAAVTTPLPENWWSTPQQGGLQGTAVSAIAGRQVLVCKYRGFGTGIEVMRDVPAGSGACKAAQGGFRCASSGKAKGDGSVRHIDSPPPATQVKSNAWTDNTKPPDKMTRDDIPVPTATKDKKEQYQLPAVQKPKAGEPTVKSVPTGKNLPEAGLPPNKVRKPPTGPGVPPITTQSGRGGDSGAPQADSEVRLPTAILERSVPYGTRYTTDRGFWSCEGTRCESTTLDLRDFYAACAPLAQVAGRVVSFRSRELQLNAHELERCNSPIVRQFYVYACSGEDDLRLHSRLRINWEVAGRRFLSSEGQPLFNYLPSHRCDWLRFAPASFPLSDLLSLHFTFESGSRIVTDGSDNWDMNRLIVQVTTDGPGGSNLTIPLINLERDPIYQFRNRDQWSYDDFAAQ